MSNQHPHQGQDYSHQNGHHGLNLAHHGSHVRVPAYSLRSLHQMALYNSAQQAGFYQPPQYYNPPPVIPAAYAPYQYSLQAQAQAQAQAQVQAQAAQQQASAAAAAGQQQQQQQQQQQYMQSTLAAAATAVQIQSGAVGVLNSSGNFVQLEYDQQSPGIRDVWAFNLREEFKKIRSLARNGYTYVAIDTEFPGTPCRPMGAFHTLQDYQYQILRANCDVLRIIQVGITLMDETGELPPGVCSWQFNFKFSLADDMYALESIDLLQASGIQFHRMETDGIDPATFAEYMLTSGLVLNDDMKWISFHSVYDFGYMYKLLMARKIPAEESEFFTDLKLLFPYVYDVKYLIKSCRNLKGGLQEIADDLHITRIGPSHQAGSDSLLTGMVFFKLREAYFESIIDDERYNGRLYGLNCAFSYGNGNAVVNPLLNPDGEIEVEGRLDELDEPERMSSASTSNEVIEFIPAASVPLVLQQAPSNQPPSPAPQPESQHQPEQQEEAAATAGVEIPEKDQPSSSSSEAVAIVLSSSEVVLVDNGSADIDVEMKDSDSISSTETAPIQTTSSSNQSQD